MLIVKSVNSKLFSGHKKLFKQQRCVNLRDSTFLAPITTLLLCHRVSLHEYTIRWEPEVDENHLWIVNRVHAEDYCIHMRCVMTGSFLSLLCVTPWLQNTVVPFLDCYSLSWKAKQENANPVAKLWCFKLCYCFICVLVSNLPCLAIVACYLSLSQNRNMADMNWKDVKLLLSEMLLFMYIACITYTHPNKWFENVTLFKLFQIRVLMSSVHLHWSHSRLFSGTPASTSPQ